MPIDCDIYIGIDEKFFKRLPQNIAYVFKCRNVKDTEKYYAYFMTFFDESCSCVIKSFSVEEFNNSLLKENQPFGIWKVYLTMGKGINNNLKTL